MLYIPFYLDSPYSQKAILVPIVQLLLRVIRWVIFILRELGIQDQTQHLRHVSGPGFLPATLTSG